MTYEEAQAKIVGKQVTVSRNGNGGEKKLLTNARVRGVVPPTANSRSFGIMYGNGNTMTGITPEDSVEIVG